MSNDIIMCTYTLNDGIAMHVCITTPNYDIDVSSVNCLTLYTQTFNTNINTITDLISVSCVNMV